MSFRTALGFSCCIPLALASLEAAAVQEVYDTAADEFAGALIGESKSDYLTSASDGDPHGALIADINGDGYGDVIAGAPSYASNGRIYVAWGASDLSGERDLASGADFTVSGSSTSGNISGAMASGDLNDDGVADLVIGAPYSASSSGAVYIVFGSISLSGELDLSLSSADVEITGLSGLTRLGTDVAVGDVNGDGVDDLIIGSPYEDIDPGDGSTLADGGAVHVLHGSSSWSSSIDLTATPADTTITGNHEDGWESRVGDRVAVGDLNGDTYDDIVFGFEQAHVSGWGAGGYPGYSGIYWVVLGAASPNASYSVHNGEFDFKVYGKGWSGSGTSTYNIGEELTVGDLDGDGYDDLILSGISYGGAPTSVSVIAGSASFSGEGNIEDLRSSVFNFASGNEGYGGLAVGEFDGTTGEDLVLGNPFGTPESRGWAGEAFIFYGGDDITGTPGVVATFDIEADADIVLQGEVSGDSFGAQVGVGDIDGDSQSDLVVGAYSSDYGSRSSAGRAYYFMGSAMAGAIPAVPAAAPVALLSLGLLLGFLGVRHLNEGSR